MDHVHMNETLLSMILFIQRARDYYITKNWVTDETNSWFDQVQKEYQKIPDKIFDTAEISKNRHNFEEMLRFQVTTEMTNSPMEALPKFKTGFWHK